MQIKCDGMLQPRLQRTSYPCNEMRCNAKFVPMDRESTDGRTTILEMHKLNEIKMLGGS